MNLSINHDKTQTIFPWSLEEAIGGQGTRNMLNTANEIKKLRDRGEQVLIEWLENPPTDRRQVQALNLIADAIQLLHAACVNLGAVEIDDSN